MMCFYTVHKKINQEMMRENFIDFLLFFSFTKLAFCFIVEIRSKIC